MMDTISYKILYLFTLLAVCELGKSKATSAMLNTSNVTPRSDFKRDTSSQDTTLTSRSNYNRDTSSRDTTISTKSNYSSTSMASDNNNNRDLNELSTTSTNMYADADLITRGASGHESSDLQDTPSPSTIGSIEYLKKLTTKNNLFGANNIQNISGYNTSASFTTEHNIINSVNNTNTAVGFKTENDTINDNAIKNISYGTAMLTTTSESFSFPNLSNFFLPDFDLDEEEEIPTLEDVENYIKNEGFVVDYLNSFLNDFQRHVVATQLKYCPLTSECGISMNIIRNPLSYKSCCEACKCNNCEIGDRTCCPSVMQDSMFEPSDKYPIGDLSEYNLGHTTQSCISDHLTLRPLTEQTGIMAIADCPGNTDPILRWRCVRPYSARVWFDDFLPVASNESRKIYRNKYCAMCSEESMFTFFKPTFSCSKESDFYRVLYPTDMISTVYANVNCDITFSAADNHTDIPKCEYIIATCNVTGKWEEYDSHVEYACNLYSAAYTDVQTEFVFRNIFCAFCNGVQPNNTVCGFNPILGTETFPFSGLLKLDFDQGFSTKNLKETAELRKTQCSQEQLYDELLETCRQLICPELQSLRNGKCVSLYDGIVSELRYEVYLRFHPKSAILLKNAFDSNSIWHMILFNYFKLEFPDLYMCDIQMAFKTKEKNHRDLQGRLHDASLLHIDVRIRFGKSNQQQDPSTISDRILQLHGGTFLFPARKNQILQFIINIMNLDAYVFNIIEKLQLETFIDTIQHEDAKTRVLALAEYAMTDERGFIYIPYSFLYPCWPGTKTINILKFMSCPKVNVSKQEIYWTEVDDRIVVDGLQIDSREFYYLDDDHIMMCVNTFIKVIDHLKPRRAVTAEIIVTIVTSSISILSLIVTLTTFVILSESRTHVPGKNNIALVVSLIIAQSLMLLGSLAPFQQYSFACKVVGLLIHFHWLSAVLWMNVCTYHMFRVFSYLKMEVVNQTSSGWKRFVFYLLYVCIISSIFVLSNIVYSYFISGDMGYGGKFCYITSQKRILFLFVVPTMFVVLANISMFFVVFANLRKTTSASLRRNVRNDRNYLIIFAKLSTLTGASWIFGGLYVLTELIVFSYIFIILNAGQGVFIMFAFVINRRVWSRIKDLFAGRKGRILAGNHAVATSKL